MTKLAVLSDLHADVHALRDALAQIDKLRCDHIVCCGDLVDYGLFPEESLALLCERKIPTIRGNHDRWAISADRRYSGGWDLTPSSIAFLESLPTSWRTTIDGVRVVIHHARPGSDMKGIAPDTPQDDLIKMLDDEYADVLLCGHTHISFARRLPGGKLVANPGALLRDAGPGCDVATPGTFGILEVRGGAREFEVRRALDGAIVALDR